MFDDAEDGWSDAASVETRSNKSYGSDDVDPHLRM